MQVFTETTNKNVVWLTRSNGNKNVKDFKYILRKLNVENAAPLNCLMLPFVLWVLTCRFSAGPVSSKSCSMIRTNIQVCTLRFSYVKVSSASQNQLIFFQDFVWQVVSLQMRINIVFTLEKWHEFTSFYSLKASTFCSIRTWHEAKPRHLYYLGYPKLCICNYSRHVTRVSSYLPVLSILNKE